MQMQSITLDQGGLLSLYPHEIPVNREYCQKEVCHGTALTPTKAS